MNTHSRFLFYAYDDALLALLWSVFSTSHSQNSNEPYRIKEYGAARNRFP